MANHITTLRLVLLFALVALIYAAAPRWQLLGAPLLATVFALDGADGYVARRRREQTEFGALYDIAADRIIEYVLWIVLTHRGFVPVWVPIVFCTRGVLVDVIRTHAAWRGQTPFGMMHTRLGRWLVAGRFMRIAYAVAKMLAFGWILVLLPIPQLYPDAWARWAPAATLARDLLVGLAVVLCVGRGVPVLVDAALAGTVPTRAAARAVQEKRSARARSEPLQPVRGD